MTQQVRYLSTIILSATVLATGFNASAAKAKKASADNQGLVVDKLEDKTLGKADAPQGGTYNIVYQVEPSTLNPMTGTDLYNQYVQGWTMDSLLERNSDTYEWRPALADKAEASADGKTITFHLRPGATFHDGHPVTAEDVKFTFDLVFDPKYKAAHKQPYYENVEKAEIVDPATVKFTLKEKYFGNFETLASMAVTPKHFYGDPSTGPGKNKTILGSGPYKLESYDQGQSIVLVKNKNWWGKDIAQEKGRYNFDKIRIRFIKDENVTLEALKKGDLDMFDDITPEAFVQKAVGPEWGTKVLKEQTKNLMPKDYMYIGWNLRRDLFKDVKVRHALALLMNRTEMIKKFRYGLSLPATGPWYQQSEYADSSVKPVPFDPKAAVQLLKEAGWSDLDHDGKLKKIVDGKKQEFKFTLYYPNKDREKYYLLYQDDLKKVGIDMQLQLLEWNALLRAMDESNFDAVTLRWAGGSIDIDPKQIWSSSSAVKGGSNFIGYKSPEVDKLIEEARVELDKPKRVKLLRQVYSKIAADYPYVFMFNDEYVLYAHSARMHMVKPTMKYEIAADYWWIAP